jgi:Domain of unknown function (DUF222)
MDARSCGAVRATRIAERAVASLVELLNPSAVPFRDASELWQAWDAIERFAASAKTMLAARVEDTGDWKRSGARSAAEHLARMGGTTVVEARRALETSKQVAELPAVLGAMQSGALSRTQADAIAGAASADPGSEQRLLEVAQRTNVTELRDECLRITAAADPDRDATHARIDAKRCLRSFTDAEGGRNLAARGTAERVARFEAALEPIIDDLFARARADGRREPREAYAFDALMMLAEGNGAPVASKRAVKPRYLALVHADVEALTRGAIEGEETCEIAGVGPVPARVARELLGEAIVKLVITKGVDVVNVTHLGRGATAAQRVAVLWSHPKCANIACSSTFVQIDHRDPWADTHYTRLDSLDRLCPHDHWLKTNEGWLLVVGKGRRAFVAPDDPRHPRNKPPPAGSVG